MTRRDRLIGAGAFAAVVALVVAVLAAADSHPQLAASEWDARVLPLVSFVEDARGHTFVHPVEVAFLSAED
jgi:hypothetical protein